MAKKKRAKARSNKNSGEVYWHFIVPCVIGGVVAWIFSGSVVLAVFVLLAVLIGNYVGYELIRKK